MKWKKLGFSAVAIIALLCMVTLASGKSGDYLIPVTINKADKTEVQGYIVLHAEELLRMGSGTSSRKWQNPRKLVEFELMKFMEGGSEVYISYRFEKEPLVTVNFFSPKGIHFTTSSSNPHVLPRYLHPGRIRSIKRTGRPEKMK
ncbi:MAG: hypothetical protein ACFFBV_08605 [Promethearchaeota archaeon]